MSKKKMKIGRVPVDPIAVQWELYRHSGQTWTRAEIAGFLGRKKTSHVIRQIEAAVERGLIIKLTGSDPAGRACFYYTYAVPLKNQAA